MLFTYDISDAVTPLDGRNKNKLMSLAPYYSELALDKYRVLVEIRYLQLLSKHGIIRTFNKRENGYIDTLLNKFGKNDYRKIREIEKGTNHDLKAVEEFIKQKLLKTSLKDVAEMVHFGLTSDDTNNIAYALIIKDSLNNIIFPEIEKIKKLLRDKAKEYKGLVMLSRTHGQPAVPTTVGKELLVYYKRSIQILDRLRKIKISAKLTGNVGNLNVHKFIYPQIDWLKYSEKFIKFLKLEPDLVTTQIEPYDSYLEIFSNLLQLNNILLGLCQDFWIYLSFGYFKQKVITSEVGSTALPHKVNPIYFEGAEGGFGIANSLLEFYIRKLSYSRLQRDLSDSTVRRSWGIAIGYCLLSYQSVNEALQRIEPSKEKLREDLNNHWEVLSEAIQNFLRNKGYKNAYDMTKKFFRGKIFNKQEFIKFVNELKVNKIDEEKLLDLTPETYTGYAEEIVDKFLNSNS